MGEGFPWSGYPGIVRACVARPWSRELRRRGSIGRLEKPSRFDPSSGDERIPLSSLPATLRYGRGSPRRICLVPVLIATLAGCGDPPARVDPPASEAAVLRHGGTSAAPGAGAGYAYGDSTAPLTVYEFSDFGCRYCAEFASRTMPLLEREFIASGQVRWIFVPVPSGAYPNGEQAARAAVCAGFQERFWEMHDVLFQEQSAWTSPRDPFPLLLEYAADLGMDPARFESCYRGDEVGGLLAQASRTALLFGVRAYPSFFVGGRLVEGALAADAFRSVLIRALPAPEQGSGSP